MSDSEPIPVEPQTRVLSEPAKRALAEAEARRKAADEVEKNNPRPRELEGRKGGQEPTRYGDWENKGIISDF
ncbi:MAG: DUF1674 domain-containing protein [Parvibaculum sp.]|nr:DUF1674 domain-containing protein [Parvibaculum sp.]|tara:strand:- start:3587 stop:3802 length:216 start_codon:yes stop_codon:yes gene_type:complete